MFITRRGTSIIKKDYQEYKQDKIYIAIPSSTGSNDRLVIELTDQTQLLLDQHGQLLSKQQFKHFRKLKC